MNCKKCFFLVLILIIFFDSYAQVPVMPDDFRVNLPNQNRGIEEAISWYELDYRYPTIDLRGLHELTSHHLPDSVIIVPPELNQYSKMTILVGVTGDQNRPTLIIWLAANYHTNRIILYTDQNQDRNFINDRKPLKIRRGGELVKIRITTSNGDLLLDLMPPQRVNETYQLRPIYDGLSLSFTAGIGVGNLDYRFIDLTYDQPTTYAVRFVEKGIKAGLTYQWRQFQLGGSVALQNHFFYTSTLDIKKGEPIRLEVPDPNLPGRTTFITVENVEKLTNKDVHSKNRLQTTLFASYAFQFGNNFSLQPVVGVGLISYLDPTYTRLSNEENETYDLNPYWFYEFGARTEFTVGLQKAVYLEFLYAVENWMPNNFISTVSHENLEVNLTVWRFNLGYRFKAF
ncbi:MAG: hypothetical protein R8G66_25460 [Cytophagales bacterium]|nr:hypothetical protein [Cytophagales bacterium]